MKMSTQKFVANMKKITLVFSYLKNPKTPIGLIHCLKGENMSYTLYKIIHFFGIFLILLSLGAIVSHRFQGGKKENFKNRKFFMGFHGLGLFLSFVAGFGLIAKAGYSFSSGWIYVKLFVWLTLGIYPLIFYRQKVNNRRPFFVLLALLILAVLSVEYKFF